MTTWTLNGRTWGYRQSDVPGSPYYLMGSQVFKVWHLLMWDLAATAAGVATSATGASTAKTSAETARDAAAASATAAGNSASAAGTAKAGAETARDAAQGHATTAETAKTGAEAARDTAQGHASTAGTAKTGAEAARDAAQGHATTAGTAKTGAEAARDAAQGHASTAATAKAGAETARDMAAGSAIATAVDRTAVAADKSATQTALAAAQTLVGTAGTGTATGLAYAAMTKSLMAATDVVAVYLYDTRFDSDGGAWATRPCGSWYWETLGTATRGATRRFPALALLVLRTTSLTIYDCHDLDASGVPRMWMVFTSSATASYALYAGGGIVTTGIFALNGRVFVTSNTGGIGGLTEIDFPGDRSHVRRDSDFAFNACRALVQRNTALTNGGSLARLVDDACHAVHARVIPGGPVDSAGLPIPTVAVATASGVSLIHPWGAVYALANAGGVNARAVILPGGRIAHGAADTLTFRVGPLFYADVSSGAWVTADYASIVNNGAGTTAIAPISGGLARATSRGLAMLLEEAAAPSAGMTALTAIDYATGWMPGDIRGAWVCDTTAGNITGSGELVNNGDFSGGNTGWLLGTDWSVTGGVATKVAGGGSWIGQNGRSFVAGATYLVQVTVTARTAGTATIATFSSFTGPASGGGQVNIGSAGAVGTYLFQFVATGSEVAIGIYGDATSAFSVDNISVRLALPDRSYKARGLVVNGTLTRTALPCGLTVVGGFSASNYLEQPYQPELDFGTGDFCFAFWFTNTGGGHFFDRWSGTGPRIRAFVSSGKLSLGVEGTGGSAFPVTTSDIVDGTPRMAVMVRRGTALEVWLNGVREAVADASTIGSISNASAVLRLGVGQNGLVPLGYGSLALFRIAAYAPTPAQIRRMYDDERALFVGGMPATLGGTSNNVTALATNETGGTLAVGTSDGVSIFAGLGRVAYHDGASTGGVMATDSVVAVSASGPHLLIGTTGTYGGVVHVSDSVIARDRLAPAGSPRASSSDPNIVRAWGVTSSTAPLDLSPRLRVGEREKLSVLVTVDARATGAVASQRGLYVRKASLYRDAGGNATLDGTVQAVPTDQEVSAAADVTLVVDAASQTLAVRVTAADSVRTVWTAKLEVINRVSEEATYAA